MLNDPTKDDEFRASKYWNSDLLDFRAAIPQFGLETTYRSNSLSGGERNRLIMRKKDGFVDHSLISGADCREDARSFSMLDYDGDGFVDIALASLNNTRLRLFRNRFGDLGAKGRVVEVILEGSNTSAEPSESKSNRDAVGALLTVETNKTKRIYRKSIGEGMAAQNSERIRVTLAEDEKIDHLSVRWPSGKATEISPAKENKLIEIKE